MSSGGDGETCKFGHVLLTNSHDNLGDSSAGVDSKIRKKIEKGEIRDLNELEEKEGEGIDALTGEPYKHVKVQAKSQGFPRAALVDAADKWDEDLDYTVGKTEEKIFVSPQSQIHQEYMQKRNQAEQNVKNTMQNISQLIQQKHMLEHDIRKLRTRTENMREDEHIIKGDFIELVDGAGGGGQGQDEASLKFYRDNNIYPSIVADFQEMRGLDDLTDPDDSDFDNPRLNNVPENEKAILRKKWAMYEKWKDLYGSEIQRKLKDLKSQLRSIEKSIEQTKEWLEPYARDIVMINEGGIEDIKAETEGYYFSLRGTSTLVRNMEFIAYKPMKNDHGVFEIEEDESKATHYRIIYIDAIHVNLAGWEQPQSPAQGPSSAIIRWHPVICCKHVFENFFKKKIKRHSNQIEQVLKEYRGEKIESEKGEKLRDARHDKDMKVRDLRNEVDEKTDTDIPIEFSSTIRRIEDGIDHPEKINEKYSTDDENILEIIEEILEIELEEHKDEETDMHEGMEKKIKKLTGQTDEFVIPDDQDPLGDLRNEMKFNFYYDYKLGLGLYTMN